TGTVALRHVEADIDGVGGCEAGGYVGAAQLNSDDTEAPVVSVRNEEPTSAFEAGDDQTVEVDGAVAVGASGRTVENSEGRVEDRRPGGQGLPEGLGHDDVEGA